MVRVAAEDQTRRAARSRFHPLQRFTVSAAGLVAAGAAVVSEHRLPAISVMVRSVRPKQAAMAPPAPSGRRMAAARCDATRQGYPSFRNGPALWHLG